MDSSANSNFERFAENLVRAYWETVKSGDFPMPPNEPVDEAVEELLSNVTHRTEFRPDLGPEGPLHLLRMTSKFGDWWQFTFRDGHRKWRLVGASAKSDNETPHDLLGPVYSQYFAPFLQHVTEVANR